MRTCVYEQENERAILGSNCVRMRANERARERVSEESESVGEWVGE